VRMPPWREGAAGWGEGGKGGHDYGE
jgi:hypothetical protein